MIAIEPMNAITMVGMLWSICRVCVSRNAEDVAASNATSAQASKADGVGLTTNKAPMKPTVIAVQRRQPTVSR